MKNLLEQIYGYIQAEPWHPAHDVYEEFQRRVDKKIISLHMQTLVEEIANTKNLELGLIKTLELVIFFHLYGSGFTPKKKWYQRWFN